MEQRDLRAFLLEKMREPGATQAKIAKKTDVAIGTINNILNDLGGDRADIRVKIAIAYGKPPTYFLPEYAAEQPTPYLTATEQRLLEAFRQLDPGEQMMAVGMIEGYAKTSGPSGIGGRDGGTERNHCA